MSDLDALLAGIVADPQNALRWLILADWLDDHDQPERAELLRLHRMLLDTCCDPESHPERAEWHGRVMELLRSGVEPCVPRRTLMLPGGVELPMVYVPLGSFRMGIPESEAYRTGEEMTHAVTLTRGFWLGVGPVTQGQWAAVTGANPSRQEGAELPVEQVSWNDAVSFCGQVAALTGVAARLPTEAEWEYAARSGTDTAFYWGGSLNGTEANCHGEHPYGTATTGPFLKTTTAVGAYAGVSPHPWGLADLIGNVWEWCADWYDAWYYAESPKEDPAGPESGLRRVIRGGGWNYLPRNCRAGGRFWNSPGLGDDGLGFRLAAGPSGQ